MLCVLLALGLYSASTAQELETTETPSGEFETTRLTLLELGYEDEEILRSIFDAAVYTFGLPADWTLTDGVMVDLNLSAFGSDLNGADGTDDDGIMLEVLFNNVFVTAIPITWQGDRIVRVEIPPQALVPYRRDARHELRITLDEEDCFSDDQTAAIVRTDTTFVLPHVLGPLPTDLHLLPRPIAQRSFLEDRALLIVPDSPTESELQAALTVSAGFAKLSNGNLTITLVPVSEVTPDALSSEHVIFTGKLTRFPQLSEVRFPPELDEDRIAELNASAEDGIVFMSESPWNEGRVVLVVSGGSDEGVVKAAQALSSGTLRTGENRSLSLVAEVQPESVQPTAPPIDFTLAQAGYPTEIMNTVGYNTVDYTFFIPPGQQLLPDAYFDLTFAHSSILDYDLSNLNVLLNDEPVASIRLNDDTTRPNTVRVALPPAVGRTGVNNLSVVANLRPRSICIDPRTQSVWLSVRSESALHLPLGPVGRTSTQIFDLSKYPNPLISSPTLDQVAFIVPEDSPAAWNAAADIAFDLGRRSRGIYINLAVAYEGNVTDDIRENYHLVVVGRPSTLPFLTHFEDVMPAPFESDSDFANEDKLPFVFRIPDGADQGYLELFSSPWESSFAVLTVLGSTEQGIEWATNALMNPTTRSTLAGNFAAINQETAFAFNAANYQEIVALPTPTPMPAGEEVAVTAVVLAAEPVVETPVAVALRPTTAPVTATTPPAPRPAWVLPAIGVTSLLMLVIILSVALYSGVQGIRSRRVRK